MNKTSLALSSVLSSFLLASAASAVDIRDMAIKNDGMESLYWDGIDKVLRGVTTIEEVYRVAKRTESDIAAA